ncbi:MAG: 3'-5' exonuclease, partial [Acidimicrobiales bacterium]
ADDPDDEMAILLPRFSTRSGPLPHFLLLPSPQGEVAAIADHCRQLLDRGVPAGEIAVLYGTRNAGGFDWPGQVQSVFAARAIPVFWATDPDRRENRDHIGEDASKVVLSTIHSAKGLEFRHVVLCGYLSDDRPDNAIHNRKLIYVGMTRATHELTLTASGRHPYIADLDTEHAPMSHPRAAGARWQSARPTPDQRQPQ